MKIDLFNSTSICNAEDPAAGAGGDPAGGGGGGATPWYNGADAETIGFIQSKGWHEHTPDKAALEAVKSYREAQQFIGAPADRIIKLPTDAADEAGWKAAYAKLGVPADAKEYDFSSVKVNDQPLEQGFQDFLRTQAAALHLPKDAAPQLATALVKYMEENATASAADKTAKLAEEHKTLDANWGANKEGNLFIAKKGAEALGFTPAEVDALEGVVGYAKIMEALRKVGAANGEHSFIGGGNGPNGSGGIMTREQASNRLSELKADQGFVKRYLDGDVQAKREMEALHVILASD